ncbi:Zn-ribbon domain-containing OB-fold protein [Paraburkholderia sp. UCT70]|uniref:Zn-ribbon domain-containing OB-fold protein n=1 Tax=Paraburkholderia sp. UCT70 TaxID=2991068 RepID=UPI003D1E40B7
MSIEAHQALLEQGQLCYQACQDCGHVWLSPHTHCPKCLGANWKWAPASGGATLVSFVVFHHAYHDALADEVPYAVGIVELSEGPRLISRLAGVADPEKFCIGQRLTYSISPRRGVAATTFLPKG